MKTFRDILNDIDDWSVSAHFREVEKLWDVLTALRGPDSGDWNTKRETTVVIRAIALPKLYNSFQALLDSEDKTTINESFLSIEHTSKHFSNHIISAAIALGIPIINNVCPQGIIEPITPQIPSIEQDAPDPPM